MNVEWRMTNVELLILSILLEKMMERSDFHKYSIFILQSSILVPYPPGSHNSGYEAKQMTAPTDARCVNQ